MKTVCDTGSTLCPHKPQCAHLCHFTDAGLEEMETRKVKPLWIGSTASSGVDGSIKPDGNAGPPVSLVMLAPSLLQFYPNKPSGA